MALGFRFHKKRNLAASARYESLAMSYLNSLFIKNIVNNFNIPRSTRHITPPFIEMARSSNLSGS